jgi:hypothetical protein
MRSVVILVLRDDSANAVFTPLGRWRIALIQPSRVGGSAPAGSARLRGARRCISTATAMGEMVLKGIGPGWTTSLERMVTEVMFARTAATRGPHRWRSQLLSGLD